MAIDHVTMDTLRAIMEANPSRFHGLVESVYLAPTKYTIPHDGDITLCKCWRLIVWRLGSKNLRIVYAECARAQPTV